MLGKIQQLTNAFWQYLNQPVFKRSNPSVWQPHRFWYLYKIQHLENCWIKDCGSQTHYTQ
jgi:hypothetical protein